MCESVLREEAAVWIVIRLPEKASSGVFAVMEGEHETEAAEKGEIVS